MLHPADECAYCTGWGVKDTHAQTLSHGRVNTLPKAGDPYDTITWEQIEAFAKNPQTVIKADAQWIIPSSYAECDARSHDAQRRQGQFHCLVVDVDDGNAAGAAAVRFGDIEKLLEDCLHSEGF